MLSTLPSFHGGMKKSSWFREMAVTDFRDALGLLGLSQYHDGLVQEGFGSWGALVDITEGDMCVSDFSKMI